MSREARRSDFYEQLEVSHCNCSVVLVLTLGAVICFSIVLDKVTLSLIVSLERSSYLFYVYYLC